MKHTILAVDDEPANLRMLERLLRREYSILTATSGDEALELLKREPVSLIITDQRMPGMTGTELLSHSIETNPDAIKIILTGYTDVDALIEAINCAKVHRYVRKPWEPIMLQETVRNALADRERSLEQKKLLDGLVDLVRSHPGAFARTDVREEILERASD
jgi:response regulator RpfG family c-di-GMP phosphodiesterase